MHNNVYWLLPLWNRHFFVIAKFILKMHNLQFWWGYVDPLWETVIQAAIRVGHAGSWFNQKLQQKIEKKYMCINGICCRADTQTENHVYVQTSIIAVCRLQILSERAVYETLDPRIILHYAHTHKSRWKPQAPLSIDVRACAFMHAKWTHPILLVRAQRTEWMGSRVMHHSTAHTGPSWHGTAPDIEIRFTVIPVRERAGDNMHIKIYRYCSFSNSLSFSFSRMPLAGMLAGMGFRFILFMFFSSLFYSFTPTSRLQCKLSSAHICDESMAQRVSSFVLACMHLHHIMRST